MGIVIYILVSGYFQPYCKYQVRRISWLGGPCGCTTSAHVFCSYSFRPTLPLIGDKFAIIHRWFDYVSFWSLLGPGRVMRQSLFEGNKQLDVMNVLDPVKLRYIALASALVSARRSVISPILSRLSASKERNPSHLDFVQTAVVVS